MTDLETKGWGVRGVGRSGVFARGVLVLFGAMASACGAGEEGSVAPDVLVTDTGDGLAETTADTGDGRVETAADSSPGVDVVTDAAGEVDGDAVGEVDGDALVTVTFAATNESVPNPGRGFYAYVDDLTTIAPEDLEAEFARGVRLVYSPIRLDAFRGSEVPESELALLSRGMDRVRDAGLGLILRFVYNDPETEQDYLDAQDAPLDRVRAHITQLAPIITAHAEVITFWQAGFIGAWGEWHTSSNGLTSGAAKAAVREALLEVLPPETFLQLRYPPDIVAAVGVEPRPEVDFATTPASRIGFHNDCFLSSDTDVGTFEAGLTDPLRAVMATLGATAPMGGETCDAEESAAQRRSCAAILDEGARYQVTYLNRDYFTAFHDTWEREGCLTEVVQSLGYRLVPRRVTHPRSAEIGANMPLSLSLANVGWARPFARRELVVTFIGEAGEFRVTTGLDARRLTPGEHTYELSVLVPALPPGDYQLALGFPATGMEPDPRRAMRLVAARDAARGQEQRVSGDFTLGSTVRITRPPAAASGVPAGWHPRDLPDARVYDASYGVTLDEPVASRRSMVTQASSSPWHPRDGAGLVWFRDRLWLLGGWYGTGVPLWDGELTTNEVWVSDDVGRTWTAVLAHDSSPPQSGPGARWPGRHTVGFLAHRFEGVEYLYVIGGDYRFPSGDVWRSRDGQQWEAVTLHAPWEGRILQMAGQYRGDLYVMGGQLDLYDPGTALSDMWRSQDGGATWTRLADAPWAARGMTYDPVEHAGKLWLMGGGTYDDAPRTFFNDVWSFDGERWTEVLADGRAPWLAREYHNTFAFDGELWVSSGYGSDGQNHGDFWHSADGVSWHELAGVGIQPGHADGIAVTPWGVVHASGNAMDTAVHLMSTTAGALMSRWADVGAARADLVAPVGRRPIWVAGAFGARPGVWLDGEAFLALGVREAQPAGRSVFWVGRSTRVAPWPDYVNPAMTVVGDSTGGCRAQAGYSEDQVELVVTDATGDWSGGHVRRGEGLVDGAAHLVGFTHAVDGTVQAWVDGVASGAPAQTSYDAVNMGWDRVGAGFADGQRAQVMLGMVVVAPRVLSDEEIGRLSAYARRWAR